MPSTSVIKRAFRESLAEVIDAKAGRGTGKKTCMGGSIISLDYLQTALNNLYKDIDLPQEKIDAIDEWAESIIRGFIHEFPRLGITNASLNTTAPIISSREEIEEEDSEGEEGNLWKKLVAENKKKPTPQQSQWQKWRSWKFNEDELEKFKDDSTGWWESEKAMTEIPAVAYHYYRTAPIDASELKVEQYFSICEHINKGKKGGKAPENVRSVVMQNVWGKSELDVLDDPVVANEVLIDQELESLLEP